MDGDETLAEQARIEHQIAGRSVCDLLRDNADGTATSPPPTGATARPGPADLDRAAPAGGGGRGRTGGPRLEHGDHVALMMDNRVEHVLADQAIVHAGGVPTTTLYSTLAPEQVRYCGAKVAILQDREVAKRWQEARDGLPELRHVVLLEDAEELAGEEGTIAWDDLLSFHS